MDHIFEIFLKKKVHLVYFGFYSIVRFSVVPFLKRDYQKRDYADLKTGLSENDD